MFRKSLLSLIALCSIFTMQTAVAKAFTFEPRLGLQYNYTTLRDATGWDQILPRKFNHIGILVGVKVHEMLGFDFEYMYGNQRKRVTSLVANSTLLGANVGGSNAVLTSKLKLNYLGLDMNGYMPLNDNLSFLLGAGFLLSSPRTQFSTDVASATLIAALEQLRGKSRLIPRITFGFEYLQDDIGIKLAYKWLNASRAKFGSIDTAVLSEGSQTPFRDSHAIGLTVFMLV